MDRRNNPHVEMREGSRDPHPHGSTQQAFLEVLTEPVCE